MDRFEDIIDSLNSLSPNDVSTLLEELKNSTLEEPLPDNIQRLSEIAQKSITERKRYDSCLNEAIARYRRLEKNIPGMVFVHVMRPDGSGTFRYVNEKSRDLFGIDPEDLIRDDCLLFGLVHPDDRERQECFIRRTIGTLQPGRDDLRHIVNGEVRWYDIIVNPTIDSNGDILVDGIVLEITDRKRAEEALRESEQRLRIANDAGRIGTYVTNLEANKVYWSPELCEILGVPSGAERTEEDAWKVVHEDDLGRVLTESNRGMDPDRGGSFCSEHRVVRPDGQMRWVLWRGRTLFRETAFGRIPSKRIGACVDITERKQMEEVLRASEQKFAMTFQASPQGFAITTFEDGRYREANSTECLMTGYSREELIGRSAFEMGFYENPEDGWRIRRLLTGNGTVNNHSIKFRRKSGEIRWGLFSASLIEFGGEKCLLSSLADVTDLHRTEESLRASEERLRLALKAADQGLYDLDVQTCEATYSPEYFSILGYNKLEHITTIKKWLNLMHPEDCARVTATFHDYIQGRIPVYSVEFRQRTKSGDWKWILSSGEIVSRDPEGKPLRMLGTHTDITRQKLVELELRRQKEELDKRTEQLEKANMALKAMVEHREAEKRAVEESLHLQIKKYILPNIVDISRCRIDRKATVYLETIKNKLEDLVSSSAHSLFVRYQDLTPTEIRVADLIRQGMSTKDIADTIGISGGSVSFHRNNIRKKLGLKKKKINLKSFLSRLS